jgi:hypothetical protein
MNEERLSELFKLVFSQEIPWLDLHEKHFQHYLTLIAALYAITLDAIYQLREQPSFLLLVAFGPLVSIFICYLGWRSCDRSYQRFLEGIAIQVKLRPLIGLLEPRPKGSAGLQPTPFPEDRHLLSDRWLEPMQYPSSAKFIKVFMNRGANGLAHSAFLILVALNVLLFAFVVYVIVVQLKGGVPILLPVPGTGLPVE